jgi:hypothetical protein
VKEKGGISGEISGSYHNQRGQRHYQLLIAKGERQHHLKAAATSMAAAKAENSAHGRRKWRQLAMA